MDPVTNGAVSTMDIAWLTFAELDAILRAYGQYAVEIWMMPDRNGYGVRLHRVPLIMMDGLHATVSRVHSSASLDPELPVSGGNGMAAPDGATQVQTRSSD